MRCRFTNNDGTFPGPSTDEIVDRQNFFFLPRRNQDSPQLTPTSYLHQATGFWPARPRYTNLDLPFIHNDQPFSESTAWVRFRQGLLLNDNFFPAVRKFRKKKNAFFLLALFHLNWFCSPRRQPGRTSWAHSERYPPNQPRFAIFRRPITNSAVSGAEGFGFYAGKRRTRPGSRKKFTPSSPCPASFAASPNSSALCGETHGFPLMARAGKDGLLLFTREWGPPRP